MFINAFKHQGKTLVRWILSHFFPSHDVVNNTCAVFTTVDHMIQVCFYNKHSCSLSVSEYSLQVMRLIQTSPIAKGAFINYDLGGGRQIRGGVIIFWGIPIGGSLFLGIPVGGSFF